AARSPPVGQGEEDGGGEDVRSCGTSPPAVVLYLPLGVEHGLQPVRGEVAVGGQRGAVLLEGALGALLVLALHVEQQVVERVDGAAPLLSELLHHVAGRGHGLREGAGVGLLQPGHLLPLELHHEGRLVQLDTCAAAATPTLRSGAGRLLPAVPAGCPTPLGLAGRRRLPSEEDVFDAVLARPPDAFVADPTGANLLSVAFLHHFLHQFEAGAGDLQPVHAHVVLVLEVDARQVYGASDAARRLLRAPSGGRLLSRLVDGEEFPACVEDAPVDMVYPVTGPGARRRRHLPYYHLTGDAAAPEAEPRWALGHPKLSSTPLVFAMAVVWLREHNRVAALLADAHPHWDGDRLYETARRVVTAEMVLVLLREVVPEVWGWGPRAPGLLRELAAPHHRHTAQRLPLPAELPLALFWGWQLPDVLEVGDDAFNVTDLMFTNQRLVVERGLGAVLQAAATQPAGKACAHNSGRLVKGWTKRLMRDGRRARLQPYARYRALLGLPAHRDFLDLAGGDARTADALLRLYGHVDAVELLPGLVAERASPGAALPPALSALTLPWLLTAALASPLGAPWSWSPDQFGGQVGWSVLEAVSLRTLVCGNVLFPAKADLAERLGLALLGGDGAGLGHGRERRQSHDENEHSLHGGVGVDGDV
ncbi:hypothetical protein FOCC_FOCC011498, partial [Frankliniella occidentalis]